MSLLREIEAAATDSHVPVADLLRKCRVLAARLKHGPFATWVANEQNGYAPPETPPSYRRVRMPLVLAHLVSPAGDQIKNSAVPLAGLPEQLREKLTEQSLVEPIATIEALCESGEQLDWKVGGDALQALGRLLPISPGLMLVDISRPLPSSSLKTVVDSVRNRVLEFVLAIEGENPDAGDGASSATPTVAPQTVNNIFNTTIAAGQAIIGNQGTATIGSGNLAKGTIAGWTGKSAPLADILAELRREAGAIADEEDREEATAAVDKIELHATREPLNLARIKQYVELYATITTVASPTLRTLIEHFGPLLEHLLK